MIENHNPHNSAKRLMIYQIRVEQHLNPEWTDWFEGTAIEVRDHDHTLITCQVVDQAALHGLLKKVRDLGLTLVSVNRVEPGQNQSLDTQE